ncbi:MAG: DNA topoisomerase IB, partial [Actinobacteria bacterium]|nr:DNA topoisomerase IB [Actinomycetota bacterium]
FAARGGKWYRVKLTSQRLARVVKHLQEIPGYELFQYLDESGERGTLESQDVNDYLREISGGDFTAKDFRTWAGTVAAAGVLRTLEPCESDRQCKQRVAHAIQLVAEELGNTPAVCRKCYVHPAVIEAYVRHRLRPIEAGEGDGRRSVICLPSTRSDRLRERPAPEPHPAGHLTRGSRRTQPLRLYQHRTGHGLPAWTP